MRQYATGAFLMLVWVSLVQVVNGDPQWIKAGIGAVVAIPLTWRLYA